MVDLGLSDGVDRGQARCAGGTTELFFSDHVADIAAAKAVCGTCSQLEACLAGATVRREPWGVWGGQLFVNGVVVAFKRPRGRPRKTPLAVPA